MAFQIPVSKEDSQQETNVSFKEEINQNEKFLPLESIATEDTPKQASKTVEEIILSITIEKPMHTLEKENVNGDQEKQPDILKTDRPDLELKNLQDSSMTVTSDSRQEKPANPLVTVKEKVDNKIVNQSNDQQISAIKQPSNRELFQLPDEVQEAVDLINKRIKSIVPEYDEYFPQRNISTLMKTCNSYQIDLIINDFLHLKDVLINHNMAFNENQDVLEQDYCSLFSKKNNI